MQITPLKVVVMSLTDIHLQHDQSWRSSCSKNVLLSLIVKEYDQSNNGRQDTCDHHVTDQTRPDHFIGIQHTSALKKRERKEKLSYSHFIFGSFEDFGHAGSEKFILHVPNLIMFKMNTNTNIIEKTDRLINVLKFRSERSNYYDNLIVLVHNHLKDKDNEQHTNIILIGNIKTNDEIVVPDTVDTQYQLILIFSYSLLNLSILLNKSESYTINIQKSQFKNTFDYFKQTHIINNKQYHSISRFTNSNNINDVYLVCGTDDQRLVRSFFKVINQLTIIKLTKSIQKYVYKKINYKGKDNQKSYERAENEIKSMKLLKDNQRFVQLVDYHDDKDNQIFHIITQYCDGGDLSQKYKHLTDLNLYEYITINHIYIEHKNRIFKESDIIKYISELFNILLNLDKHGIIHCDIKPSNIFIDESDGTLILGDFGCCKFIDQSTIVEYQDTNLFFKAPVVIKSVSNSKEISDPTIFDMNSKTLINATRGTIGYISPEAMNRQYAQSCDIFSIGSTILKLLCCHPDDRNNHQIFQSTGEIKISECRYSKQLIEFIHRLLDQSPKNRESLNQLLNQYIETITNQHLITFNLNTTFKNRSVNITEIKFGNEFNQPLQSNSLPPNLTSLEFGISFNQILSVGVLPKSLKSLVFGYLFNQILSVGVLPKSLKSLEFGDRFNQILSVGVLPESLESLKFGNEFNQILSVGVLPESLKSLEFGDRFNQILSVGVLPKSLESLKFGGEFNQILSVGVLPESLESLKFGREFNQILSFGVLPESLESLEFGGEFNQILSVGVLPESLKSLVFDWKFNQILLDGVLPESLKSLEFGGEFNQILSVGVLPKSLKSLVFGDKFNQILSVGVLPESLKLLKFGRKFNQILSVGVLPELLESLKLGEFNQILSVGVLPESLKSLEFDWKFNQILSVGVLPESLESLKFGYSFNQILSVGVLPKSLKSLEFGYEFNQILSVDVLPKSLESLSFGDEFNQILSVGVLPESLESLSFGYSFNQILSVGVLPKSLKSLKFGYKFNQILSFSVLPKSISSLIISGIQKDSVNQSKLALNLKILEINDGHYRHPQTITTLQLTNSQDSLSFIKEFYPEYYSTHNLSLISDSFVDSQSNQIKGEYIIALLLHNRNIIL
ncbi:putative calmodulin-binding protein [Heterostelium album PN500]|uniref:Putative calmodulin-binding protein n=1 Tax=Heterostelium pallidum (strain ATCC 26659 / Pp 5 / PN500) TaxID=670386 RepID=D3BV95_HETP5|nr:putative calmodulin-binding protein [Heterostelium album PN500]EFA74652.1 putative calmodulin-binding protein [Heterostelium album PN500]|eukprot:XP_020426786.1 putative calmodulin-binding protein [Heterostelium album PN500]